MVDWDTCHKIASSAPMEEKIRIRAVVDVARIMRGEGGLKLFCLGGKWPAWVNSLPKGVGKAGINHDSWFIRSWSN